MSARRTLITGAEGQDGWFLSTLLDGSDDVLGTVRDGAPVPPGHPLAASGRLVALDVTDAAAVRDVIHELAPDRVFHLAGFSSAGRSWTSPAECLAVNTGGVSNVIQALQDLPRQDVAPRLVMASSAEIFQSDSPLPFDERTPLGPRNPYGVSKAAAHQLVQAYRSHGANFSNAILFNHESWLRGENFVTGRIAAGVAGIVSGRIEHIVLGNLDARRDWTFAGDVADALAAIADLPDAGDWVVAGGVSRSVADFAATAFASVGIDDWESHVRVDESLLRTGDAPEQRGDASRLTAATGWRPATEFETWVGDMVRAALASEPAAGTPS
jgi:GDPmannose 4,6-dehydratase